MDRGCDRQLLSIESCMEDHWMSPRLNPWQQKWCHIYGYVTRGMCINNLMSGIGIGKELFIRPHQCGMVLVLFREWCQLLPLDSIVMVLLALTWRIR